ncbi:hypothetical protein TWF730_008241 [Orbilia blumenaviensis]|uniref:Uncharacterized protein n=1 Tax=Orbilia blumenaviensis TaxID=1796055 RepID=A0AAV9V4Z1_9PEZI
MNDYPYFLGSIDNFYNDDTTSTAHRNSVPNHIFATSPSETLGSYKSSYSREAPSTIITSPSFTDSTRDSYQDNSPLYSPQSHISTSSLQFAHLDGSDGHSSCSFDQLVHHNSVKNSLHKPAEEAVCEQPQHVRTKSIFLCDWMNAALEMDTDPARQGCGYIRTPPSRCTGQYNDTGPRHQFVSVDHPEIYDRAYFPLHSAVSVANREPNSTKAKNFQDTLGKDYGTTDNELKPIKRKKIPNEDNLVTVSIAKKTRYTSIRDIKETLGFSHPDGRSENEREGNCGGGDGTGWQRLYSNWRKDIASMAVPFVSLEAFTKSTKYTDSEVDSNGRQLNVIHGTFKWHGWNEMSESEQKGFLKSVFGLPWFGVTHSSAKIDEWIKNGFSPSIGENSDVGAIVDAAKAVILDVFKKRKDGMKSAYIGAYIDGIIEVDSSGMISARHKRDEEQFMEDERLDQKTKLHHTNACVTANPTNPALSGQDLPVRYIRFYPDDDSSFVSNSLDTAYPYEPNPNLFASLGRLNIHSARIADIQIAMAALDANNSLRRILGMLKSEDRKTKLRMPISSDRELQAWLMTNGDSRGPFDIYCIFRRNPATNGGRADSPAPRHSRYLS